jgi:hypothetical protein
MKPDVSLSGLPSFWRVKKTKKKTGGKKNEPRDFGEGMTTVIVKKDGKWQLSDYFQPNRILLDAEPQIGKTNAALYTLILLQKALKSLKLQPVTREVSVAFPTNIRIPPHFSLPEVHRCITQLL